MLKYILKLQQPSCDHIGTCPYILRMANAKTEGIQVLDQNWPKEKKNISCLWTSYKVVILKRYILGTMMSEYHKE